MVSSEIIDFTKETVSGIDGVSIIDDFFENDKTDFVMRFNSEGQTFLLKIQSEPDEASEDTHIFSINYMLRIKNIPKTKKEIDILKSVNEFNEKYAITKCIFVSNEDKSCVFWFRTESLTNKKTAASIIKGNIGSLKSAPALLTNLIRG